MLNIGLVLPDVLGTYGDDGNALVLRQRARMRGFEAEIHPIRLGEPVPETLDIYTLGGGEDTAQILAADHLIPMAALPAPLTPAAPSLPFAPACKSSANPSAPPAALSTASGCSTPPRPACRTAPSAR